MRQASKQTTKDNYIHLKVEELEKEAKLLRSKLEKTEERLGELNKFTNDQKNKLEDLNKKYNKLDDRRNIKYATQAVQTTLGRQIGKIMTARDAVVSANEDVKNSILYQCAEEAAKEIKL